MSSGTHRRTLVALALLLGAAGLPGCAKLSPVGDAKGGIVDWFASTKGQVQEAAAAHCARYGKAGRIVDTQSDRGGGHAIFVCE